MSPNKAMTYGERAVGLDFNPSGDDDVHRVKTLMAELIDILNEERGTAKTAEKTRLFGIAIIEAQTAQMWAVKALTWKDE